jgi:hypothetical protein
MSAAFRLRDAQPRTLRVLGASGQLGFGMPHDAFRAGLARSPDVIGADAGSVDIGPACLGSGQPSASEPMLERDLALLLEGARTLDVPLLVGSAGGAGAAPHLEHTLALVRRLARARGLRFRLAAIRADIPKALLHAALADGRAAPCGAMPALTAAEIEGAERLVAQMGTEAFIRALETGADVIIAGRACDTAIFDATPVWLGFDHGLASHMAKIIECSSLACEPGGRDAILAELAAEGFVLESMNPGRRATPLSVAAHALYEQADPFTVAEPEGVLHLDAARYDALDDRRVRVSGSRFVPATGPTIKVEGAARAGSRVLLVATTADPGFAAQLPQALARVEAAVRAMTQATFSIHPRLYRGAETVLLIDVVAPHAPQAMQAAKSLRQLLLHHGFPGRLCTGGNLAFPIAPPELAAGDVFRWCVHHIVQVAALAPLFPVEVEDI